jgi:Asp-tRNA(Asn)/Glu-tRNA(Gln) amidotransferase A subunit family amidase
MRALCDWRPEYILQQAAESHDRYLAGKPLSDLDGTFAVVKDHVAVKGLTSRYGLSFHNKIQDEDQILITRMKNAGIIIVGISHMTQLGMSVFGSNPSKLHGTCKNPVNTKYYPGASSSGTAGAHFE